MAVVCIDLVRLVEVNHRILQNRVVLFLSIHARSFKPSFIVYTYTVHQGVEDDGCHSLLDYDAVAESARVLECIARSLNAVVVERKMIQNEIVNDGDGKIYKGDKEILAVYEPSVFGMGREHHPQNDDGQMSPEPADDSESEQQLAKEPGVFTRAEVTIQRVETHLLDPSPISLSKLAESNSANGKNDNSTSTLEPNGENLSEPSGTSPENGEGAQSAKNNEIFSIQETLSARNIRVAVVGNVDAGKCWFVVTETKMCPWSLHDVQCCEARCVFQWTLPGSAAAPCRYKLVYVLLTCFDTFVILMFRQVDSDWYTDDIKSRRWTWKEPHIHHETPSRNRKWPNIYCHDASYGIQINWRTDYGEGSGQSQQEED